MSNTPIVLPHLFVPRDYQLEVFQDLDGIKGQPDSRIKRIILNWPRRCGKDLLSWNFTIKRAMETKGSYYYILLEAEQGRKVIWEGIDPLTGRGFLDYIPKDLISGTNNLTMTVKLINGSIIRVIGATDPDTIRGANPAGVVFSEYAFHKSTEIWDSVIQPIMMQNKGWVIFNSTPKGRNHYYDLIQLASKNPDWRVYEFQTYAPGFEGRPYRPIISEKEFESMRASGTKEDKLKREFGCSFLTSVGGAYYLDLLTKARNEGRIGSYVPNKSKPVDTFWDLGVNDSTTIWFRQVDGNKEVFIDFYSAKGEGYEHYARVLAEKGYHYRTHFIPHDGSHREQSSAMIRSNILRDIFKDYMVKGWVQVCDKILRKQEGIEMVRSRFPKFHFNEATCEEGLKAIEAYSSKFNERTQEWSSEPDHDWASHAADALMLVAQAEAYETDIMADIMSTNTPVNAIQFTDILGDDPRNGTI